MRALERRRLELTAALVALSLVAVGCGSTVRGRDPIGGDAAAAEDAIGAQQAGAAGGMTSSAGGSSTAGTGVGARPGAAPGVGGSTGATGSGSQGPGAAPTGPAGGSGAASSPGGGGSAGSPGAAGSPVAPSGPGAAGTDAPSGAEGSGATGGAVGAGAADAGPVEGRGFTAEEILLGFGTQDDVNQASANAGFGAGLTFGNTQAQVQAVLDYVNEQGGVLGRQLVPVFNDTSSTESDAVAAQAACTTWTQDNQVFGVMNPVGPTSNETLFQCLQSAGTPLLRYIGANTDAAAYDMYEIYSPANITGLRMVPTWLARLQAQDYFAMWDTAAGGPGDAEVKVGLVLTYKHAELRRLLELELARLGHPPVEVFEAQEGASSSEYAAAVLRFAGSGVTHVFAPSAEILYFMLTAEPQGYRPRYAINSWQAPAAILQLAAPVEQMSGSVGVGYVPSVDVDLSNDPGDVSESTTVCREIMQENGQDTTVRLTFLVMLAECEMVFLLQEALSSQGALTNEALRTAVDGLGDRFPSAMTFTTMLGPGRHDGASRVRDLSYVDECACFRYGDTLTPL